MGTVGLLLDPADTVDPAFGCILGGLPAVDYSHAGAVVACAGHLPAPFVPFAPSVPGAADSPVRWGRLGSASEACPHSLLLVAFPDPEDTGRQEDVHP